MLIEFNQITKKYGHHLALDDISLQLEDGPIGLLGPNGAGKSTLIKLLLGLVSIQVGDGKVLGHDIRRQTQFIRQHIGYMPENDAFIPGMDGIHYVAYCAQLSGLSRKDSLARAHEVLDYLAMDEERYRPIESFSTGMRQKVKLAQALVHDPKMVFLDEPTNGLDPSGREEMLKVIDSLWRDYKISFILSSHLLPDVEKVCEKIVILVRGKIQSVEDLGEMTAQREKAYLATFRGDEVKDFIAALEKKGHKVNNLQTDQYKISFEDMDETLPFFELAKQHDVQVRKFKKAQNTLEDVFLKKLGV